MPITNFEPQKPKLTYLPVKQIAIFNASQLWSEFDQSWLALFIAYQSLIGEIWEEGTIASAEIALVCGLKVRPGCQDMLMWSDADETLA